MAGSVAQRMWRESSPGAVEQDLSALWRELGEGVGIARATMSNLVVFRCARRGAPPRKTADDIFQGLPIDAVAARHPCRVIFIDHEAAAADAVPTISTGVGVVTYGPPHARYGVEQIAVHAACDEASLPSIVRRLVRGELPTSVWWADDPSRVSPVNAIIAMGRQLIYDSCKWRDVRRGILALAPFVASADSADARTDSRHAARGPGVDLADVNWRRLKPMRQALVFAARSERGSMEWVPADVRIAHRPGDGALAWLLAGWLASRLRWDSWPRIVEERHGDMVLSISIGAGTAAITASMDRGRVVVSEGATPPSVLQVPHEGEADAVAAELHSLTVDICLHDALSALLRSFRAV